MDARLSTAPDHMAAVIWLDRSHALVARAHAGRPEVTEVDRALDGESDYLLRVVHEAADCDKVVVMGPDASRVAFEREYVFLYHRPERLIDLGRVIAPRESDLIDQLRLVEPSLATAH